MNLWHEVQLGEKAPEEFNVIVEVPKGSSNKYEIDKSTGLIALDRANYTATAYPFDYGFAPQTLWDDGDPLDVILLTTFPLYPGALARVRPVALMDMMDGGESDVKIIAVPVDDQRWEEVHDLADIHKRQLEEYKNFFETYKMLKKGDPDSKKVEVRGYGDRAAAQKAIEKSMALYQQKIVA
jgi:inorganic pyrophosphatase